MFEDDEDDDLEMSEAEAWYDNNLRFFDWKNNPTPGLPLGVELFYHSVYVPFKKELKEPLRQMVNRHYEYIATECRPEVLARIERKIASATALMAWSFNSLARGFETQKGI